MPVHSCELPGGGSGYKWGSQGKCYPTRAQAEKQAEAAYSNGYTGDALAFDKLSIRSKDVDGHLHVDQTPISKAVINGYYGQEIPGSKEMGLKPHQLYKLLRDPTELKKGAETFEGKPLQLVHKGQSATDHDRAVVVGAVHNPRFDGQFLKADLAIWDADAIKRIESGEQRELSCGYRYTPDMTPGEFEGQKYDGVMRNIVGNHVALVEKGRAGPDVMVGDSEPLMEKSVMTVKTKAAFIQLAADFDQRAAGLNPSLAMDSVLIATYNGLAADARARARDEDDDEEAAMDEPLKVPGLKMTPKGEDEAEETEEKEAEKRARDRKARDKKAADKKAADKKAADAKRARDLGETIENKETGEDENKRDENERKEAMDAAINTRVAALMAADRANQVAVRAAEAHVRPVVGELAIACDSAAQVYQTACKLRGIDHGDVTDPKALKLVFDTLTRAAPTRAPGLAMDSSSVKAIAATRPGLARFL